MSLLVITNNPKVYEYCISKNKRVTYVEGTPKNVLSYTRDRLLANSKLAADPLGGYCSRPNPYHSVFLQESIHSEAGGEDILRIEMAMTYPKRYAECESSMSRQLKEQYKELDFSIAVNTLEGLLRNIDFHE
jgi:hypothetical protein